MSADGAAEPAAAGLPRRLGPYLLEGRIAQGASSVLMRGRDPRVGRPLAIKVLRLRPADAGAADELRQRFMREAEAARRLVHPGIVRYLDAGDEQGLAWIAMELVPGHDLGRHVQPGALLPLPATLDVGAQLADALAHAHRHGVVHRDIKPANVIFDVATGAAVLTDFGIARVADASRTRTGLVLGTPAYMAPELLAGGAASAASDIYALGVLLFQLLCGRLPFEADTLAALMKQIVNDAAPGLRGLRPDLPEALDTLVSQMLAKARASRPGDGAEVARALRTIATELEAGHSTARGWR